jgi:uncharacterized protein (TIGR04141 family)
VTIQLTIFKIKPEISNVDEITVVGRDVWSEAVRLDAANIGILHVKRTRPKPPAWVGLFPTVDFVGKMPTTASAAACFVVRRPSGYYAIVFGFGRYLLKVGVVDERFGLRVALNATELTQLRSLDHKRLESVPRHTREQLSKGGTVGQFGLDIERDLLRGLTASPKDSSLGNRMTGSDSLVVTGPLTLSQLPHLLDEYSRLSQADDYREVFPWVDNIAQVRDKRVIERLDETVVSLLRAGNESLWLAVPEPVHWSNIAGFKYTRSKTAETYDDLDLATYYLACGRADEMTLGRLRTDIVRCVRADDGNDWHRWPIHQCLVGELTVNGEQYVLSEGQWFRIDRDFLAEVETWIQGLTKASAGLPSFTGGDEQVYCKRAARKSQGVLHLLDRDLISYGQHRSIEACDLYSRERVFIHVKKYGASSVLSHLFAQGAVSGELFYNEPSFRTAVSEKLPPAYQWGDPSVPPTPQQFEIQYAVICQPGKRLELPFFSKVNLKKESRRLRQLGFKVSLVGIPA